MTYEDKLKENRCWVTDRWLYLSYSYPKVRHTEPRVTKQMTTKGHPYSCDYKLWVKILDTYFEFLLEDLFNGEHLSLPNGLGTIAMGAVRRIHTHSGRTYRNLPDMNLRYFPTLFWFKGRAKYNCTIKNKNILRLSLSRRWFKRAMDKMIDDPYIVYRWHKDPLSDSIFQDTNRKAKRW